MNKFNRILMCLAVPVAFFAVPQQASAGNDVCERIVDNGMFVKADRSAMRASTTTLKSIKLRDGKTFKILRDADGTVSARFVAPGAANTTIGNSRNAAWVAPRSVAHTHFFEDFEDYDLETADWIPDGWQDVSMMTPPTGSYTTANENYTWAVGQFRGILNGNYGAVIKKMMEKDANGEYTGFGSKQDEWLISPAFTPDEGSALRFQFAYKPSYTLFNMKAFMDSYNAGGVPVYKFDGEGNAILEVHVSTDNGVTWTKLWDCVEMARKFTRQQLLNDLQSSSYVFDEPVIPIDEYIGKEIRVAFRYVGADGEMMMVDRVSTRPVIEASYKRPEGALFNGFSKNLSMLSGNLMLTAPYVDTKWINTSSSNCEAFEWSFDGEGADTRDFTINHQIGFYPMPQLTASAPLADNSVYDYPDADMVQFGGTFSLGGAGEIKSAGLGNCRLAKKFTSWGFGRDAYADWMWTILFGLANNETWVVDKVGNYFEKPVSPYYFTEMWVNCVTDCTDDAEFVMELYHINDGKLDDKPFALGRCKGSDVLSFDISGGLNKSSYEIIPFKFYKVEDDKEVALPYIVVDSPMMAFISGFGDPAKVAYYDTFTQYEPNEDGECNTYLIFDITAEDGTKSSRMIPSSNITNGKPLCVSCCFNMDAVYPWLTDADGETAFEASAEGGSKLFSLRSYFDHTALSVQPSAEWVRCDVSSKSVNVDFSGYVMTEYEMSLDVKVDPLPEGVTSRECDVTVQGPAVSATYKVTQGEAGVEKVTVSRAKVAVTAGEFIVDVVADDEVDIFDACGRKVASRSLSAGRNVIAATDLPKGVYIFRFASQEVLKAVR
ncbi:MAG: choice-of-anchor J domain-containing protein [Muribaculaceae bacterium]